MRLAVIILLLILSGCGQKYCMKYYPPMRIDTSWVDTIINNYRDTVLIIQPPDYGLMEALVACDSLGQVYVMEIERYQAGKRVTPVLSFANNRMTIECKVDSLKVFSMIWNKTIKIKNVKAKNSLIEVNVLTWWQKTQIIGFWVFFSIVVIVVGWKVLSAKTNLLKFIK
jgi:hypothetical protein